MCMSVFSAPIAIINELIAPMRLESVNDRIIRIGRFFYVVRFELGRSVCMCIVDVNVAQLAKQFGIYRINWTPLEKCAILFRRACCQFLSLIYLHVFRVLTSKLLTHLH